MPFEWPQEQIASLQYDTDEVALGVFYAAYCVHEIPCKSAHELKQVGNGALFAAAKVLGLEGLRQESSTRFMKHYNEALRLLNSALTCPVAAKEDCTLLSTIIMTAIEIKISPQLSIEDYFNHVKGATALLELRGPDQVLTKLGAALYMQVSAQLYMSCVFGQHEVPKQFRELRAQIVPYLKSDTLSCWREHGVLMRYVDFKVMADALLQQGEMSPEQGRVVITEALEIYGDYNSIFLAAPAIWRFRSVDVSSKPWAGTQQIYECFIAAQSWTGFRVTTLALFDIIDKALQLCSDSRYLLEFVSEDHKLYVENASCIVRDAAISVLASTPQQVDYLSSRLAQPRQENEYRTPLAPPSFEKTHIFHCDPFVHERVDEVANLPYVFASGFNIFQSVFLAASTAVVDLELRRRLAEVLRYIGTDTGIRQAVSLAQMLQATPIR